MRLPRDVSGSDLAHSLRKLGYSVTRQTGSHLLAIADTTDTDLGMTRVPSLISPDRD